MTIQELQKSMEFGDVFNLEEFRSDVEEGYFTPYDGIGYLHDGEKRTKISVWSINIFDAEWEKYPYVCWFNK